VELECSVQYAQEYPVLWMKVDRNRITQPLPISTGSSLIIPDGRFSLRYDTASSTYTLQVSQDNHLAVLVCYTDPTCFFNVFVWLCQN
jgi:hypothetical protein